MFTPEKRTAETLNQGRRPLTNRAGLPQVVVDAVANDGYSKGDADISVTGLLKPARMSALEALHSHEIEQDASDKIWSLLGQAVHTILERANRTAIAERRLSMELDGWKISGGMDLYEEDGALLDFKVTSVHKLIQGNLDEWSQQLNSYSVLLRHHGHQVNKLQVIAILRDWSKLEARRNPDYPQAQVMNVDIPLWDPEKALKFMRERVILHQQARVELPECSAEDRWARPDVWAVMRCGRKRAVKLCTSKDEALTYAGSDKNLYVIHRKGTSVRCESYCSCLSFCTQGQQLIQTNPIKQGE